MSLTWDNLGGVEQIEENFGKLQQKNRHINFMCRFFAVFSTYQLLFFSTYKQKRLAEVVPGPPELKCVSSRQILKNHLTRYLTPRIIVS